ncbi:MJ0042-type zinc finger domain-containing protein [Chloroflexota bacterium]
MIIECPKCGAKNTTDKSPQPGKEYRCGKCGASITFLQTIDTPSETTSFSVKHKTGNTVTENTSGQGKLTVVPQEIKGWNWGAFLLGLVWGAGNNVWWSLLLFIPYFGTVWIFVMGVKGNEWAWKSKKWDSIEHFQKTQGKWRNWGIGIYAFFVLIWFIIALS